MNVVEMRNLSIIFVLLLITISSFSQITINLPLSRSVFQRDNKNSSSIYVSGNYDNTLEKIEARLVPIKQGQGSTTDWAIIADKPEVGSFTGAIKGTGGWYELQVRGWRNGIVVAENSVDKVGIGEVFLIAGQSNAEGKRGYGEKPSVDDRVNCYDYKKTDFLDEIPPFGQFSHLETTSSIAPRGDGGAWCWGELGDLLVKRLNVPVMFFNVAYGGTSIENWYNSSIGIPTKHNFFGFTFPRETPYSYMRITLQYYLSQLGVRAVLWCQGEAEMDVKTPENYYLVTLKKLIDKSRSDSGKKISWVVTRTTYTSFVPNITETSAGIIRAQNKIINPADFIFEGPNTDSIQVPRPDGVHFENIPNFAGISELAKAWDKKLNANFFNQSISFLPAPILPLKATCASFDKVKLALATSYSFQKWSNNSTEPTITAADGTFSCMARDFTGNYFFTSSIKVKSVFPTKAPLAFAKTSPSFCDGASADLITNNSDYPAFLWSTGETQKQITVKSANRYTVRGINAAGCGSPESNFVFTTILPLPPKPNIYISTTNTVCEGTTINLASTGIYDNFWSTGDIGPVITVSKSGDYTVSVITKDANNCASLSSEPVKLSIIPRPEVPEITQVGAFTLQAKQKNLLSNVDYEWKKDGILLSTKTPFVKITKPGFLTVSTVQNIIISNTQTLTCRSNLSGAFSFIPDLLLKSIILYPNPSPNGFVTLEAQEDLTDIAFVVYSPEGKYIYSTLIPALTERRLVDLSFLSEGAYIIKLVNATFEETKHIFIEKQ